MIWRVGAMLAAPINARNTIKPYASDGLSTRANNNYRQADIIGQYRWGSGIYIDAIPRIESAIVVSTAAHDCHRGIILSRKLPALEIR